MKVLKVKVIRDLMEKNKRIFKIPVFQRDYVWEKKNAEELFDDVMSAFDKNKEHFLSTIVYKPIESSSRLEEAVIIDGQQRLTTIYIFLKALYDLLNEKKSKKSDDENRALNDIRAYLYNTNCDKEFKIKLKPIDKDNTQLEYLLNDEFSKLDKNAKIVKNYGFLKQQCNAYEGSLLDILEGLDKLRVAEIVLEQDDDPQLIFESLNSKGQPLSKADLIRNFLFTEDNNQEYLYEKYWIPLEKNTTTKDSEGKEELKCEEFFRLFLVSKHNPKVAKRNIYREFKGYSKERLQSKEQLLEEVRRNSEYYGSFLGVRNDYNAEITELLRFFVIANQTTPYAYFLYLFECLDKGELEESDIINILKFLRLYLLMRIICNFKSNTLQKLFVALQKRLEERQKECSNQSEHYYTYLVNYLQYEANKKDRMPSKEDFLKALNNFDMYNSQKDLTKYLFTKLENHNKNDWIDFSDDAKYSIEHILPQRKDNLAWKNDLGVEEYKDCYENYLHTLGNLTIIHKSANSEMSDKSFGKKKETLLNEQKSRIGLNAYFQKIEIWNKEAILERAEDLGAKILDTFAYKQVKKSYVLQKVLETNAKDWLTLEDNFDWTGQKFEYIIFLEQQEYVDSFKDLLAKTLGILYSLDKEKLHYLASIDYTYTRERVYLSLKKDVINTEPRELKDTGIFYETNLNANNIRDFIKKLLGEFDINPQDFKIALKKKS
ncbi:DUF262 domain-containing protein [Helicobacter cetorum]|uniref:DUF262 domain-containing protein n=1 Tax=Helicobacter cetorum TaxID=138563 RepID=UPI000CF0C29C|nr:DUF262 domain-containing protein [Helicobacter cetorum]